MCHDSYILHLFTYVAHTERLRFIVWRTAHADGIQTFIFLKDNFATSACSLTVK